MCIGRHGGGGGDAIANGVFRVFGHTMRSCVYGIMAISWVWGWGWVGLDGIGYIWVSGVGMGMGMVYGTSRMIPLG